MKKTVFSRLYIMSCALFLAVTISSFAFAQKPSTIVPVSRDKEDWWVQRHNSMNDRVKQGNVDLIFIGDSITHGWEDGGKDVWAKYYAKRNAVNLGISGDRTENVLWRLENGNIKGISPKLAVIMIGTNNAGANTPEEIALGIKTIVEKLRKDLPKTKILVLSVFPREEKPGELRAKLTKVNDLIAKFDDGKNVFVLDIGPKFLQPDGTLPKEIMPDALHPNAQGYQIWADAIEDSVAKLMGEKK